MPWVSIDDKMPEHPKVVAAGEPAFVLFVCGLAYSNRHLTDGHIPQDVVCRLVNGTALKRAAALVRVGLWDVDNERGGWTIHDYLDYQPSREKVLSVRAKRAEAGARGGKQTASKTAANGAANEKQKRTPTPNPSTNPKDQVPPLVELTLVEPPVPPPVANPNHVVFCLWRETTGHLKARLDGKRNRTIGRALREYPFDDVCDAIRGWTQSSWHRGQNPDGRVYDSLELILRDAEHLERFRDLERYGPQRQPVMPRGTDFVLELARKHDAQGQIA